MCGSLSRIHLRLDLQVPAGRSLNMLRVCLVREIKNFGCHIDVSEECWEGFLDTNKKTNYRTHQETARRI